MRILVISDIHGNLAALEAVLNDSRDACNQIYCLGDITGYGPDSGACIKKTMDCASIILGGNHDIAASEVLSLEDFADHARQDMNVVRACLSAEDKAYLARLPLKKTAGEILLSHGSPEDPLWGYIFSCQDAALAFASFSEKICFFGHTHIPSYFTEHRNGTALSYDAGYGEDGLSISTGNSNGMARRFLLNPGSVGLPRDEKDAHNPKRFHKAAARYALFDTETGVWQFRRIFYDFRATAARMTWQGF
jgi:predicted phosphodiesterase